MSEWKRRRLSLPDREYVESGENLQPLLESGAYSAENLFLPPGGTRWLTAAEALAHMQQGADGPTGAPVAVGIPLDGQAANPAPQARAAAEEVDPMAPAWGSQAAPAPQFGPQPAPPAGGDWRWPGEQTAAAEINARQAAPASHPQPAPRAPSDASGGVGAAPRAADAAVTSTSRSTADDTIGVWRGRKRGPFEEDELEMTPMIDMTFLLLIFFMVAGTISQHGGVELPPSLSGSAEDPRSRVVLVLDFPEKVDEGTAALPGGKPLLLSNARLRFSGGKPFSAAELESRLATEFASRPDGQLVLQAHRKMPASVVRQVLRAARQAGAKETLVGVVVSR